MYYIRRIIEKYIIEFNPDDDKLQTVGCSALLLVWKDFCMEEEIEDYICAADLQYYSDGASPIKEIIRIEREMLIMNNYVICPLITP